MIKAIFSKLCPNCGGDISSERLTKGLPCERCLPVVEHDLCKSIKDGSLKSICNVEEELLEWMEEFKRGLSASPWALQKTWAKRVLVGSSFALLAPTGVGKTSFGLSMVSFLAKKGKKSYVILPTKLLVEQTVRKLKDFGIKENEILFFGDDKNKEKEEKKKRLVEGQFLVLITTSMFLYKNYQIIPKDFSFIFVDDVDSFLKTAKNVDKALYLLGYTEEDIELALKLIKLKEKPNKSQEDWDKIRDYSKQLREISNQKAGVLVVSSATSNPKSSRIKLFRELLGFEVGTPTFYLRNIVDAYEDINALPLEEWIRKLGKGGLIFVPSDKGKEYVDLLKEELSFKGISSLTYEELTEENLRLFESGQVDVLIGIASYRNPLARGFDMPHVVRYALFYGVPKIVVSLKLESNLSHLLWALSSIRSNIVKKLPQLSQKLDGWLSQLRSYQYLTEEFLSDKPELKAKIDRLKAELEEFLRSEEVLSILRQSEDVSLRVTEEGYQLVVSDVTGYLQASGRTSRMFAGGISKGLSLVLVDDKRAFNHLIKKVRWFSEDIQFVKVGEINLEELMQEIEKDRNLIREFIKSEKPSNNTDLLKPVLIVVESPNKARTIANFFGKAVRRRVGGHEVLETSTESRYLMITASLGHVLDLVNEGGFHGVILNDGIQPMYEVIEGKRELVESLRKLAFESEEVFIATDPDAEGEKIGWDIAQLLKPFAKSIKRMEFHEITKKAIVKALNELRDVDENKVKAQIVRRVSDRWVGFEFSQMLWSAFGKNWLSAGRVQTPVLGWIVEREKEHRKKIYKVLVNLGEKDRRLVVEFSFEDKQSAKEFFDSLEYVEVHTLSEKEELRYPPPPYRTDTMLKDASDKYRFSLPKTMELAQTLFELGFITYHRTDSVRVSDYGIALAKEYIKEEFGEEYFNPRVWGEGGAHECIRPTKMLEPEELRSMQVSGQLEGITNQHILLYELIFKRFVASQMKPVKVKVKEILIKAGNLEQKKEIIAEVLEDGWNKVLPLELSLSLEGKLDVRELKQFRKQPKAYLYTHGELVQEMKNRGVGRPSTYAMIISKLIERGYVIERKNFLIPTSLGKMVYEYLSKEEKIKKFLSEQFTKELEELMDLVAEGKADYQKILKDLYQDIISVEQEVEVRR
ncbi:reverse gyrase [Thermocrinis jamiesonii]|jgi:Reverse gyrase|uniref:reverse gyrase n=1 Tax=Thermocrinis jamiesonii TaxID=1302351 RepID=UPI000497AA63|nr:reverse gyrase [Thermocrinis jamiesonii]